MMRKTLLNLILAASAAFLLSGPTEAQQGLIASDRLLGRDTTGTGQVEQITVGGGLGFTGTGGIQISDAELTCLAGLTSAADKFPYFTGSGTCALGDVTAFARTILDDTSEAAFKATVNLEIGTDVQAYDADLDTWSGVTPSANGQSLVSAANYAAMRGLLDLEPGTDFYSVAGADAAFQPLDSDLTSIAALTTTSFGRGLLELADETALEALPDTLPNLTSIQGLADTRADAGFDVLWGWDDTASGYKNFALGDLTAEGSPAAGDCIVIYGAEGDVRCADWSTLPGSSGLPGDPGFDGVLLYDNTTDDQAEWATYADAFSAITGNAQLFGNIKITEITASGTFTADANSTGALVFVTGSGGGGGGAAATDSASAAGAGAGSNGETRLIYYNPTQMGATAAVTIGAAGTAGANTGTNGGAGNPSSFNPVGTGDTVTANGGLGGIGVNTVGFVFDVGGAAGSAGSNGILLSPSVGSGAGFATSPGSGNNKAIGGQGSSSYWSSGGGGGASNGAAAAAGYAGARGSGGGGGAESDNGGSAPGGLGGAGYVLVIEFLRS